MGNTAFSQISKKRIYANITEGAKVLQSIIKLEDKVSLLRILTGKKRPKIKLQRLRKILVWTFGSLVHQINTF